MEKKFDQTDKTALYKQGDFCIVYYPPSQGKREEDLILRFAACSQGRFRYQ